MQTSEMLDQFANFCQLVFDTSTACFYDDARQTSSSFNSPNEKASQRNSSTQRAAMGPRQYASAI
jgi:hypothetical protein